MNLKVRLPGFVIATVLLATVISLKSQASHYMGSDITYTNLSPNVYVVTGKIYRDCSGAALSTAETLSIKSPGCNTGRTIPFPLVPGSVATGTNLYCPGSQAQAQCSGSATLPNFETGTYRATVTFTTAERTCNNWYLSLRLGNRPSIENLGGSAAQGTWLYSEAYLKLSNTINNNSPEFAPTNIPIPFVCVNQDITLSMNASEADGDSLSYELARPLDAFNMAISYGINNNPGNMLPANASQPYLDSVSGLCNVYNTTIAPACSSMYKGNPLDPRPLPFQTAILPASFCSGTGGGASNAYSANNPLPTAGMGIDWVSGCKTNVQAKSGRFSLDPLTGVVRFTPNVFHPNTAPSAGRNKYAVVVQINEWRKINGLMTKVGHVRRDILVIINNCANMMPVVNVPNPNPNTGAIFVQDTVFNVMCCTTTSFGIRHLDADPADLLNVTFPDAVLMPSGFYEFPANGAYSGIPGLLMKPYTNHQNAVNIGFYMTPNTSVVGTDYFLRSVISDNACPVNARIEQVYRLHVISGNQAAPVANIRDVTIAPGQSHAINIAFQRPDSMIVNNVLVPVQYSYFWTETNASGGLPNGLNAANRTNKDIVVTPTQDTRYFLTITSPAAGCTDTTSVMVRISSPTGTSSFSQAQGSLVVYPNPFNKEVSFTFNNVKNESSLLVIYNVLGQEAGRLPLQNLPGGKQTITWDKAVNLPAGQYIARLISENGSNQTVKFVKLH